MKPRERTRKRKNELFGGGPSKNRKADTKRRTKEALLQALEHTLGNVSQACAAVGCSREAYYNYRREDEDFAKRADFVGEKNLDFAETKLLQNIRKGDNTAIIFFLKTKGKERGYSERHEFTGAGGGAGAVEQR